MNIAVIANNMVFHHVVAEQLRRRNQLYTSSEKCYEVKTTKFIRVSSMDNVRYIGFDGFVDLIQRHDNQHYFEVQEYFKHTFQREYYEDQIGGIPDEITV